MIDFMDDSTLPISVTDVWKKIIANFSEKG